MPKRTKLTYIKNWQYSIWREDDDDSAEYNLEEHEEEPYDISIIIRYTAKTDHHIAKEECLAVAADDVIMMEVDDLQVQIESTLNRFGVGNVGARKEMVDVMMEKIWYKGVYYCPCYCKSSSGPKIVMEVAELLDDEFPPAFED